MTFCIPSPRPSSSWLLAACTLVLPVALRLVLGPRECLLGVSGWRSVCGLLFTVVESCVHKVLPGDIHSLAAVELGRASASSGALCTREAGAHAISALLSLRADAEVVFHCRYAVSRRVRVPMSGSLYGPRGLSGDRVGAPICVLSGHLSSSW